MADRLVGDKDAARGQPFLDIAIAQGEAEIEPDGVADDLRRRAVAGIGDSWSRSRPRSLPISQAAFNLTIPMTVNPSVPLQ